MKRLLTILAIINLNTAHAQYQAVQKTMVDAGFLYPGFSDGMVLLKSGQRTSASLNYNAFEQSIVYYADQKSMTLTNIEDVDTVYLQHNLFIPVGMKFYMLIDYTPLPLVVSYEAKPLHKVATVDHITNGKQDQNTVFNTVTDVYVNGQVREDINYTVVTIYWIKDGEKLYKANNEKQIAHIFGKKTDQILQYAKEHKTNFRSMQEVVELVRFAQE
jgi:hypothetical protein